MNTATNIQGEIRSFSRSYQSALAKHLLRSPDSMPAPEVSRKLGNRALKLGVDVLGLARIHDGAFGAVEKKDLSALATNEQTRRSSTFFDSVLVPIEESRFTASDLNHRLNTSIEDLTLRTEELDRSDKKLLAETARRKEIEKSLRTSEEATRQLRERARLMQEEMRSLSHRFITAQENERKRISRDLHDVIAQTLAGINVRLAVLRLQSTANHENFHKEIEITELLVEHSVEIVHRFASDLRPVILDDIGLIPALESHIDSFTKHYGIPVKLFASPKVEELKSLALTKLFRIAQEALTNIGRHSRANLVELEIRPTKKSFRMIISDDGQGFIINESSPAREAQPLGILGMRERAEMAGGSFQIKSIVGEGTVIRVEIPRAATAPAKLLKTKRRSLRPARSPRPTKEAI